MKGPVGIKEDRWLLPEGIVEMLPAQANHLEQLRRQLLDLFYCWGYDLVMPPLIEYLDSLLVGTGEDLDLQTFKLIDQLTGRLMGMRADMTPQVARIDAHVLKQAAPARLCYLGPVLHTRPQGYGRSRAPLQVGAELYGHAGIESDVEILRLMVETLTVCGVAQIHVDVGHVGIYRGLIEDAGLDNGQESLLFGALQRKAKPEIDEYLSQWDVAATQRRQLMALVDLNGDIDVLGEARSVLSGAGPSVQAALKNIEDIARLAQRYIGELPLYFDLAELRGYRYQTGVVFAAFVPGHGQEIARGGRYDNIGKAFGRARPATGFSADLKTLEQLSELTAQPVGGIWAPAVEDSRLDQRIAQLRSEGSRVVQGLPDQVGDGAQSGCDRMLAWRDGEWQLVPAE